MSNQLVNQKLKATQSENTPWKALAEAFGAGQNAKIHVVLIVVFALGFLIGIPENLIESFLWAIVPIYGAVREGVKLRFGWNFATYVIAIIAVFSPTVADLLTQGMDIVLPLIESIKEGGALPFGQITALLSFLYGVWQTFKKDEDENVSERGIAQPMGFISERGVPDPTVVDADAKEESVNAALHKLPEGAKILLEYRVTGRLMFSYQVKNSPAPKAVHFFCAPVGDTGQGRTVVIEFEKNKVYEKSNHQRALDAAVDLEQRVSSYLQVEGMQGPVAGGVWFGPAKAELIRWHAAK